MQKLGFSQLLQQKLSPQQIQFIKLLQVPTAELESRIEQELEINPALEEGKEEPEEISQDDYEEKDNTDDDLNLDDYLRHDDVGGYKMQGDGADPNQEDNEVPVVGKLSFHDALLEQVGFLRLDERKTIIAKQLVGSIESDGYIRRDLESIVNDLAFSQNLMTDEDEVEDILFKIQNFDPPGVGARNLQECLIIQLDRKEKDYQVVNNALEILENNFELFTKKHYDKILKKYEWTDEELKDAVTLITKLNPKPGSAAGNSQNAQVIIPDFIILNEDGELKVTLNARNAPELRVSRSYADMMDTYDKSDKKDKKMKETVTFVKQKLDAAKWFIDAIRQRQETLLKTMNAIVKYQYDYFLEGDESKLKPMILKDIAEVIDMDISTVSRVANSKFVQTEYGTFSLKHFFSESLTTESGEDVSSKEVKHHLKNIIESEDKKKPLSDEKIEKLLKEKGYNIARRTVAKYREQLNIPVARLRKEL